MLESLLFCTRLFPIGKHPMLFESTIIFPKANDISLPAQKHLISTCSWPKEDTNESSLHQIVNEIGNIADMN